jgi:hypothetical protein
MFDYALRAEIKRVEVLVPKVDGPVTKVCRITFRRDLDAEIARSLAGEFGVAALKHLHDRGISKIEFPIDAITARAVITGTDGAHLAIDVVTGMKAIAKVKKLKDDKDADCPQVELKFQFPYTPDAWAFCGDNACVTIDLKLTRNQLSLDLNPAAKPAAAESNGKKARKKGGSKSSHGDDRAEAAGEIADPQDAATPEEAEEVRAQRLRERDQQDANVWAGDEAH